MLGFDRTHIMRVHLISPSMNPVPGEDTLDVHTMYSLCVAEPI